MTEPRNLPDDVRSEEITFHDVKGYPTEDRSKAVSAEIITVYKDGRTESSLIDIPRS